jgi:acyl-CoA thioesterase-1
LQRGTSSGRRRGGLNDLGQPDEQVTKNAGVVVQRMAQTFPQAKVVLLGPVATTGTATPRQKDVVAALGKAAKSANVPFIDATGWITPDNVRSILGPDKVQPTDDGHKVLAGQLEKVLRDLGLAAS